MANKMDAASAGEREPLTYEDCAKADADAAEQWAVAYVAGVGVSKEAMIDALSTLRALVITHERRASLSGGGSEPVEVGRSSRGVVDRVHFSPRHYIRRIGELEEANSALQARVGELVKERDYIEANRDSVLAMNAEPSATLATYREAGGSIRDAILNERFQLAESGIESDQVNAVLGVIDDFWPLDAPPVAGQKEVTDAVQD